MIGGEDNLTGGSPQHLQRRPGPGDQRRGTADVDVGRAELDHGASIDHHRHPLGDVEGRTIGKRRTGQSRADEICLFIARRGVVPGVADDADDPRGGVGGGQRILDRLVGGSERAEVEDGSGIGRCRRLGERKLRRAGERLDDGASGNTNANGDAAEHQIGIAGHRDQGRPSRDRGLGVGPGLVDEDRPGSSGGLKPGVEGAAGNAVAVAVEGGAGGIDKRVGDRSQGSEVEFQFVGAVRLAGIPRVADVGVERDIARSRHGEKIVSGCQIEADKRIAAVVVVVAGHHRADAAILAVQREHGVEGAQHRLPRPGDKCLGGQCAGAVEGELIDIDIRAGPRIEVIEVHNVVIEGKDVFSSRSRNRGLSPSHHRGDVVGMLESY